MFAFSQGLTDLPPLLGACLSFALPVLGIVLVKKFSRANNIPLPPGPPGLPVIGNVLDIPSEEEWKTFAEWGRKYGGICSISLLGQRMIIVNTPSALDQLEKHGSLFSGRPYMEMGGELCGYSKTLVLAPYAPRWRGYRKLVSKVIGTPSANERFASLEEQETAIFLRRVLSHPEKLSEHIRATSGAIILRLTYGIEFEDQDQFVDLIKDANDNFVVACQPGRWLVDMAPRLMKLWPESLMTGGNFKAAARKFAKAFDDMVEVPYAFVKKQVAGHTAPPSFVSNLLTEKAQLNEDEIFEIKHAAASMYGGGADTTASGEYAFFLAMTLYPEVQRIAQAEIDSVIGNERLVKLSDRPNLPYVNAVVTELLRWNSVAPTGVPHLAVGEGTVDGYYIPKGSIIITNLWQILHDEDTYPDPFTFDPTRHIATPDKPSQRDPRFASFGWGRRVCPGLHLAEATVFLMIANSLAVFDISKAKDEHGIEITPVHENTTGVISHPKPFKCSVKPRHSRVATLVAEGCEGSN